VKRRVPKRRRLESPLWRWLCLAALVAATGCETFHPPTLFPAPEPVDLTPLLEVETDASHGLAAVFPDYEALVIGGVQQWNGQVRQDGVVELLKGSYDSELDEAHRWFVDVTVTLFDTPARAARDLDSSCYSFRRGAGDSPVRARKGQYCASPAVQAHTDSQNLYLPANVTSSWVFVRRDRIVVRLYERHMGSAKSAKNGIIGDIAARLGKLKSSPPSAREFRE